MRIIAVSDGESLDSYVSDDFGHAPYFLLVDSDTLDYDVIVNEFMDSLEGAGIAVAKAIVSLGMVDAVITGGIGPHGIKILQDAGIYTSAVFSVTSFAEADAVARELQRAFEVSLAAEIGGAGVDELLLTDLPISVDTLDDVPAYISEIAAQLPQTVQLAVAVPPELVEGASGTVLSKQLSQYADTIALDLRGLVPDADETYPEAVSDIFAEASLYFSKYNMRVLLPDADDATFTELRQVLELNAVRNWQVVE